MIHFRATGLAKASNANELRERIRKAYPERREQTIGLWTRWSLHLFHEMRAGDLVLLPLKKDRGYVAVGEVEGPVEERPDLREYKPGYFVYSRPVRWLVDRCPREYFGDWLSQPHTTTCPVQERDAEQRVRELIRKPLT